MPRAEKPAPAPAAVEVEMLAENVERWPIAKLTPYVNNARTHSVEQIDKLAHAITTYGWTIPALVDENGLLIAGHGRLLAAQKLGITSIPVIVAKGWSEDKRRAYTIADNRLGELSGWDADILAINKEMHLEGDYSIDLLVEAIVVEAAAPAAPKVVVDDTGKDKRTGPTMTADKKKMLRFALREIPLQPSEMDWLIKQMKRHLTIYGVSMGFVEKTLKPASAALDDAVAGAM